LLPFFDKEKSRLHEIIQKLLKEQKPTPENRAFVQIQYFRDLLSDKSFAYDDPFARIHLAEYIEDPYLLYHELGSCKLYLQEYNPELLPFLEKEEAKFRENYPDFQLVDKNRERMRSRIYIASNRERATLICA
jgi:hypothetical protein